MNLPRSRSRKNKKKHTRQASPEQLQLISPLPIQPEAGPSRLPEQRPRLQEEQIPRVTAMFTPDTDFIAFADPDDDKPKRSTREWDRGKHEWDRDRDRGRDRDTQWERNGGKHGSNGRMAGTKRGWDEVEQDNVLNRGRQGVTANTKSRKAPWASGVDWDGCRNVAEMMHKEVEAFLIYISPTPIEHEVRWMVVQLISNAIEKTYPDAKVLPFGSFGTKLYLPQGDIDLVVQSESMVYSDRVVVLRSLANIVRRTGITDKVTVIAKAKVPIIKFITTHGRFSVDISMNQVNGVQAGNMINRFLEEFPALRGLVLVVKSFLNQRSMNEVYSGGLGSYAIVCLTVSFLQMHPKLRRAEIDPSRNLGVLVMDFFELYGKYFNYTETGISLRHGGSYFSKVGRGWQDYYKPYLLSIEDPGDISAYELMKSAAYVRASIISARRNGHVVDLRSGSGSGPGSKRDPEEMSILSSILGVGQETINHRRLVMEVYDSGELARLLGVVPRNGLSMQSSSANGNDTYKATALVTADGPQRALEAQSVTEAWEEADMVLDSDMESEKGRELSRGNDHRRARDADAAESEKESRYTIPQGQPRGPGRVQSQGGPARKRRRTTSAQNVAPAATVFITDDDDEEEGQIDSLVTSEHRKTWGEHSDDELEEIEQAYAAVDRLREGEYSLYAKGSWKEENATSRGHKPLRSDQRRAFWASKSMRGIESDSS
ncbi:hypothetical protein EW145_g279 [Phellinidium pouzarii]|uniref:polynucleotide adenylyltransferase n=1 Tax=Phellinidium pouzarii TaxID=167371 RepID=A0A4S4LIX0_9AGAM|nr:hypothetical protein EW145_g279 [Phellinidium pouzarii]